MEATLLILGFVCVIAGALGSFLPLLPGPPLSYAGIWLLHFSSSENRLSAWPLLIFGLVTLLVSILDYIIPAWGARKFGGSKWGMWGSTIGLIVGLFFGPPGIIAGPFIGAFVGEILNNKRTDEALRSAVGSFVGFLFGSGIKLIACIAMLVFYFKQAVHPLGQLIRSI